MKNTYNELLLKANPKNPIVIGVIGSRSELLDVTMFATLCNITLRPLSELKRVSAYEIRLDKLVGLEEETLDFVKSNSESPNSKPLIITARDASQGGDQLSWTADDRIKLYESYMEYATMLDVGAETAHTLMSVIEKAHANGVGIIASFHSAKSRDSLTLSTVDRSSTVIPRKG